MASLGVEDGSSHSSRTQSLEGSQVEESGPPPRESLDVINDYKEVCTACLEKLEECSDEKTKESLKPLKQMVEDLLEQNGLLVKLVEGTEADFKRQMSQMHRRLGQEHSLASALETHSLQEQVNKSAEDVKSLLKMLESFSESGEVPLDQITLHTISPDDVLRSLEKGNINRRGRRNSSQQSVSSSQRSSVLNAPTRSFGLGGSESAGSSPERLPEPSQLSATIPSSVPTCECEKYGVPGKPYFEPRESSWSDWSNVGKWTLLDDLAEKRSVIKNHQEELLVRKDNGGSSSKCECGLLKAAELQTVAVQVEPTDQQEPSVSLELSKVRADAARLELELVKRNASLAAAQETIKAMGTSFKETRWALAAEVAEKHDQILDLRRIVAALEEQLRQADMQTHFKDDIIKKMRLELKYSRTTPRSEGRRLCDVVTEVTQQRRLEEAMTPGLEQRRHEEGSSEAEEAGRSGDAPTPRECLSLIKEAFQSGFQRMEQQESAGTRLMARRLDVAEPLEPSTTSASSVTDLRDDFLDTHAERLSQIQSRLQHSEPAQEILSARKGDGDHGGRSQSPYEGNHPSAQLVRNKTRFALSKIQDVGTHIEGLLAQIQLNNKISERGDWSSCASQLKNLEWELREVESHLLDVAGAFREVDSVPVPDACVCHKNSWQLLNAQLEEKDSVLQRLKEELDSLKDTRENALEMGGKAKEDMAGLLGLVNEMLQKLAVNNSASESEDPDINSLKTRLSFLQETLFNVYLPEIKAQLAAEQKLVSNKEETLQTLHARVELREKQVESFTAKVKDLERQLEEQRQVIAELQQAVQDCKKLEMKVRDKEICSLRFEVCELDMKQRMFEKELKKKDDACEQAQDENDSLRRRLDSVGQDFRKLQSELKSWQDSTAQHQKISADLEKDLQHRDAEIVALQQQVQKLEAEAESEVKRAEGNYVHDGKVIAALKDQVNILQSQLRGLRQEYSEVMADAEVRFLAEKAHASEQRHKLIIQNQDFSHTIRELTCENELLSKQAHQFRVMGETSAKKFLKKEQERQNEWERKIKHLEQQLKNNEAKNQSDLRECERKVKSMEKTAKKSEEVNRKLSEMMELDKREKKDLQIQIKEHEAVVQELQASCRHLQRVDSERQEQLKQWETRELSDLGELETTVRAMHAENVALKKRCSSLSAELDMQTNVRRDLERDIEHQHQFIKKLQGKCDEWAHRYEEAHASEIEVRKALHRLKEEGMQRLRQEKGAKVAAEDELSSVKQEIVQLQKLKADYDDLTASNSKVLENLQSSIRAKGNLEKLLSRIEEEKRGVEVERAAFEMELERVKEEKALLQDKVASLSRTKDREVQNCAADKARSLDLYKRTCAKLEDACIKLQNYEGQLIPEMNRALAKQERIIDALKAEVQEANASCMRMRQEALHLIESTETLFTSNAGGGDGRRVDVAAINESLFAEMQRKRSLGAGALDPWSPAPPAAHSVWARQHTRLHDSCEGFVESGFQSMMQSPVNMMSDMRGCAPERDLQDLHQCLNISKS